MKMEFDPMGINAAVRAMNREMEDKKAQQEIADMQSKLPGWFSYNREWEKERINKHAYKIMQDAVANYALEVPVDGDIMGRVMEYIEHLGKIAYDVPTCTPTKVREYLDKCDDDRAWWKKILRIKK